MSLSIWASPTTLSFPTQWNLRNTGQNSGTPGVDIKAVQAWDITTGSSNVVVAVIDSGVDYTHEDLAANMWRNEADCNNNGIDDDGNGYIDDCYGIDAFNDDSNPMDDHHNHGTHVAGIIGAVGNNSVGVVGVNWNVKIMACKFLGADGFGTVADAIQCLEYVKMMRDRGVNIVATNNSWGGGGFSQALYDAIEAHTQRGILFIAAAGNGLSNNDVIPVYPAGYYFPNVVAVAANDRRECKSTISFFGRRTVHLAAPGEDILSTIIGNNYAGFTGSSMAAPHVTGVAALIRAQNPQRDWKAIKNLILASGDVSECPFVFPDMYITAKTLNAQRALSCSNSVVRTRLRPIATKNLIEEEPVRWGVGRPLLLSVLHINCAQPNGTVVVPISPGSATVTLRDDGVGADQVAGDGIYSAHWTPTTGGTFTLSFPDGDLVTVDADPHLKLGFPS